MIEQGSLLRFGFLVKNGAILFCSSPMIDALFVILNAQVKNTVVSVAWQRSHG